MKMKTKRKLLEAFVWVIFSVCIAVLILAQFGCRQADIVSSNISKEADAFNVQRKITVINARTDTVMLELIGTFSLHTNSANSELEVICEVGPNCYQKHFIYLNEYTLYVVQDISGADVDKYHFELNILPFLNTPQVKIDYTD